MTKQEIAALQKLRPNAPHFQDDYAFACYCALYLFARQYCHTKTVLDAACGYGYGSRLLAETAQAVTGIDISKDAIDYSNTHFKQPNIKFQYMDVTILDFPEHSFDVVVSIETFEHFPPENTTSFIHAVQRVLRPGGLLILSTPVREVYDQIAKTESHINEVGAKEFSGLFSHNFRDVQFYLMQRNAMKNRQAVNQLADKDRFGLRKIVPAEIRKRLKRGMAAGLRQSLPEMLRYWQVFPAKDIADLESAIFQIVVCKNKA